MPKLSLRLLMAFLLFSLFPHPVHAQEQFGTKYNVRYQISPDGEALVTQNISIINRENDVVATTYTLTIDKTEIYDIKAEDSDGEMEVETTSENGVTRLSVTFNEQVIGKDRSLDWKLEYKTRDLAGKVGEIWNINIPKVEVLTSTEEYNVELVVPESFGPKIYVSPQTIQESESAGTRVLKFDKTGLQENGITASFGSYQVLNFQLKYKLENASVFATYKDIPLPPSIDKVQQVKITSVEPAPQKVFNDADGNLMASFRIDPNSVIEVKVTGSVRIAGTQIDPKQGGLMTEIPRSLKTRYTKQDEFWETHSREIRTKAKELYDANLTTSENAQRIYEFVVGTLKYNFDTKTGQPVERHGALEALTQVGPWTCMEFTDVFIALARANGIPARELNGYAIAKDPTLTPLSINFESGDVLHSWAEFYDPNYGWVQVDPTWGNTSGIDYFTKLDTNHFAFAIKGLDSERPYPAGEYKLDGTEKQVEVDIAQNPETISFDEPLIPDYPRDNSRWRDITLSVFGAILLCSLIYSSVIRRDPLSK